jgi:capsular polysaccharide biosynthesis protein
MNTVTLGDLWGTIKRRIVPILLITLVCAGLVVAQGLLKSEQVLTTTYTAEATLYVSGASYTGEALAYNYELDEDRELENARRIVTSDTVAGSIRREFSERDPDLTISSPFPYDPAKADRVFTNFIYIDATSTDPDVALEAADATAELAAQQIAATLNKVQVVTVYEQAILKSTDGSHAAEPSQELTGDAVLGSTSSSAASAFASIDKKNLAIALFVGLFGSAFVCCVYEILNRKIRTAHDAEALIGIPVIAKVSATDGLDSLGAEQELAKLTDDIQVLLPDDAAKIISVASIANAQMTTEVTSALAASMVAAQLPATIVTAAGEQTPNLEALKAAVAAAAESGGFVLIDAGALSQGASATMAVAASSAVLLVTRQQEAASAQIKQAIRQLQIADTPMLGIALLTSK